MPGRGILFKKNKELGMESYTIADYAPFLRGNIVTWRSKKPNEVARSSAEAEFSVMADGMNFFIKLEVKFFPTRVFRKRN